MSFFGDLKNHLIAGAKVIAPVAASAIPVVGPLAGKPLANILMNMVFKGDERKVSTYRGWMELASVLQEKYMSGDPVKGEELKGKVRKDLEEMYGREPKEREVDLVAALVVNMVKDES